MYPTTDRDRYDYDTYYCPDHRTYYTDDEECEQCELEHNREPEPADLENHGEPEPWMLGAPDDEPEPDPPASDALPVPVRPLDSTWLRGTAYAPIGDGRGVLALVLSNGGTMVYGPVDWWVVGLLHASASAGRAYNLLVRGRYPYHRVAV